MPAEAAGIVAGVILHSVTRRFRFSAAHHLPNHGGACRFNHGHNFEAFVTVEGELATDGPSEGMVFEFGDLKAVWEHTPLGALDHSDLNESLPRDFQPATTENIAAYILTTFRREHVPVTSVRVVETENNEATARWVA